MIYSESELNKYYRYAVALTNNDDQAFDLVHDSLLKVSSKFFLKKDAYILKTIRNTFLNSKKLKDNNYTPLEDKHGLEEINLENIIINKSNLDSLLSQISEQDRELLFLVEVEGYTYKEVANLQGISQGTLLSKLHRIKKFLKNWSDKNE